MTKEDQTAHLHTVENSETKPLLIRPDMPRDKRNVWQNTDPVFIDKILIDAFTARSDDEVVLAKYALQSIQGQCLLHIQRMSDWELVYREYQHELNFEHDEKAFSEVIAFLAGVGASLAGVSHQLGYSHLLDHSQMKDNSTSDLNYKS